jgi:hypothetical protein
MSNKFSLWEIIPFTIAIILFIGSFFIPEKYNLYDYLKSKRLQSYNEKNKEHFLTCIYCKGTGERVEDTNRIIFMARVQLYLNKHLAVDKCKDCVKLEHGDSYIYCDEAEKQYQIFLQEYGAAGPKMEKTSCGECMGMGTFSSFDIKTQKYLTQEEYEQRERNQINNND